MRGILNGLVGRSLRGGCMVFSDRFSGIRLGSLVTAGFLTLPLVDDFFPSDSICFLFDSIGTQQTTEFESLLVSVFSSYSTKVFGNCLP